MSSGESILKRNSIDSIVQLDGSEEDICENSLEIKKKKDSLTVSTRYY